MNRNQFQTNYSQGGAAKDSHYQGDDVYQSFKSQSKQQQEDSDSGEDFDYGDEYDEEEPLDNL